MIFEIRHMDCVVCVDRMDGFKLVNVFMHVVCSDRLPAATGLCCPQCREHVYMARVHACCLHRHACMLCSYMHCSNSFCLLGRFADCLARMKQPKDWRKWHLNVARKVGLPSRKDLEAKLTSGKIEPLRLGTGCSGAGVVEEAGAR